MDISIKKWIKNEATGESNPLKKSVSTQIYLYFNQRNLWRATFQSVALNWIKLAICKTNLNGSL